MISPVGCNISDIYYNNGGTVYTKIYTTTGRCFVNMTIDTNI